MSFVKKLFGFDEPKLPPVEKVVTRDDPAIAKRREETRLADKKRRGRKFNVLTGGQGVTGPAPVVRPALGGTALTGGRTALG